MATAKKPKSIDQMLAEKMKILSELCVVKETNKKAVYDYLVEAVISNPTKNARGVLDRAARMLITGKIEI